MNRSSPHLLRLKATASRRYRAVDTLYAVDTPFQLRVATSLSPKVFEFEKGDRLWVRTTGYPGQYTMFMWQPYGESVSKYTIDDAHLDIIKKHARS